jgi:hypothetical protein
LYEAVRTPAASVDLIGGCDCSISRTRSTDTQRKRRLGADRRSCHFDIGTGESKLTWQAMIGFGDSFGWGDVLAAWRHLDYDMKSGDTIDSLSFDGPLVAAVFRWQRVGPPSLIEASRSHCDTKANDSPVVDV